MILPPWASFCCPYCIYSEDSLGNKLKTAYFTLFYKRFANFKVLIHKNLDLLVLEHLVGIPRNPLIPLKHPSDHFEIPGPHLLGLVQTDF